MSQPKKRRERNYVVRPDGKPINVPRTRGQLFICENGCCCGHTDRGFAPVPHDLYYEEWVRRKFRNRVHLNHAGCLGPCALANLAMLIFDGRPIWFHSVNSDRIILAIYDYIEAMLEADRYLPPPPHLADHVFNGFAWDGTEARQPEMSAPASLPATVPDETSLLALGDAHILLLSHADTDLLTLNQAAHTLPADFHPIRGVNLSSLPTTSHVDEFIRTELAEVQVIILRSLGGRQGFIHGFDRLVHYAKRHHKDLICVPGTEGLDPELTAHSTVPVPVIHDVYRYLHYGGIDNMRQMLYCLADHLLAGGWGFEQPVEQPRHGIYRRSGDQEIRRLTDDGSNPQSPNLPISTLQSLPDGLAPHDNSRPTIAILFYRSHWLSGNTDFIDALIDQIEANGGNALPIFTTSLKETTSSPNQTPTPPTYPTPTNSNNSINSTNSNNSTNSTNVIPAAFDYLYTPTGNLIPDVIISTISFAMGGINPDGPTAAGWNVSTLEALNIPILQAISSGMRVEEWQLSQRGLRPLDVAMNVALPEFDGRIITVPISFKGEAKPQKNGSTCCGEAVCTCADDQQSAISGQRYVPVPDRVQAVINQAMRYAVLRRKPNRQKRIVFMLTNSPGKADRIGNAVGLDTPASLLRLFAAMREQGYHIENIPDSGDALLHELIDRCSYDETLLTESQLSRAAGWVPVETYAGWFDQLTPSQQRRMHDRWQAPPGEAYVHLDAQGREQHLALAGLDLGNVFVALQPPRGYGMDPDAIYHTPDLPPTHNYYALYKWLATPQAEGGWGADAIVHMGKHGTLEWLPGKGIGLSLDCYPDAFLADLPLIYPFIINNPGEGAQAKRRAHAAVVDHMIPPMTSADVYGELATLTQLVDEYYQVEQMDPSKLPLIQQQIWQLMQQTNLDRDITELMGKVDHGDHTHEWDGSYTDDGTPLTLAEMNATDFSHLLEDIDGYLCELGSLQIRDGLHTLGYIPEGDQLCHLLRALTRIPNGSIPSLRAEVATGLTFDLETLLAERGRRLETRDWRLDHLKQQWPERPYATHADVIDLIDDLCLQLIQHLAAHNFAAETVELAIKTVLKTPPTPTNSHQIPPSPSAPPPTSTPQLTIINSLTFICTTLVPLIRRNGDEIANVLNALNGGYVPAGPAGAPTRGMAHILPTGRNFYAVDPQAIPSQAAWRVGQQLADELITRYQSEENDFPESVGLSIWGTSAMRTHGDDIAQCLALLGVRPVWQAESRRVKTFEIISLETLGRPRIDVLMRISGFFRDAFPHLIELMDEAAHRVALLDEPVDQNFVRKHFLQDLAGQLAAGRTDEEAVRRASYRIFGSKPGSYGAGILPLIHEQNWQNESDFAEAYVNWGGYAYGQNIYGDDAREEFKDVLGGVQIAVKNQDNREHDIFDSDDYLQYHGGMIATIRALNGRNPKSYFGDNSNPEKAQVHTLQHEAHRVFRSRVVNPKWIESIKRHGYKGALELAATVDYLFGYDATAQVVDDWMYEQTAQTYALDPALQEFFQQSNPWALQSITERLLEAAQRGMWSEPNAETLEKLRAIYLQIDEELEGRNI
ncbi:MAG: cobaltochelatase subunit CobN [Anaerolineales bacterium]|nr:cobaltochelatase subunit CobN [Anaerolineales bacterium]